SLIELGDAGFEVNATSGDNNLGGDDYDNEHVDLTVDEFQKDNGIALKQDLHALSGLNEAAEQATSQLSRTLSTEINQPSITADADGPKHLDLSLSRSKFDELTADLVEKTVKPTRQAMADAGVTSDDIDQVILVGGSTRIPAVQEIVKKITGKEPN